MSKRLSVLLAVFLVLILLSAQVSAYEMSIGVRAEFKPANYTIVPIDDGTKIVPMTPLMRLYNWRTEVIFFIDNIFQDTPYHEFVQIEVIPIISSLMKTFPFVVFFFRKKPESYKPNSTAGKILAFLEANPVSSEPTIIRGVGKSRGAVAYQLHLLLFDDCIYAAEIFGKTYYSLRPISADSPETAVYILKNNATQSAIFAYICEHPGVTRKELAEAFSLSLSTVRHHLERIDSRLIKKELCEGRETYTAEEWAAALFQATGICIS